MNIGAELQEQHDRAEQRENAVITALPYLLLAVGTVITVAQPAFVADRPLALGLSATAALWMIWYFVLRRRGRDSAMVKGAYYAGLTVLAAALVALAPFYGVFAFAGYLQTVLLLPGRWQYLGAASTSMIMAMAYLGGAASISADGDWWLWAAISLVSTVLSVIFIRFAEGGYSRGLQLREAMTELHQANAKLEASVEENAALHAQLVVQAREAGVQDERQRVAREIHDTLAQSLAGILTQLQAAEQTLADSGDSRRHLTTAMELARESLTEARRTVHAVQPQVLDEARLPDVINDLVLRWSQDHRVEAALVTTGDGRPLHPEIEMALLRTAQESLANVAKHANADRVGLTLSYMEDLVTLDVRDDGIGFDIEATRQGSTAGGFGLIGMRQRIQRLAGSLSLESEVGGGTAISASLPAIPVPDGDSWSPC